MTKQELLIQKQLVKAFEELKIKEKELESEVMALGWEQRNALVSHVYSNYSEHELLNSARQRWDKKVLERNVHKWVYDKMVEHRDEWGYFEDYVILITEIDEIYNASIKKKEYEIASTLQLWLNKLGNKKEN